MTQLNSSSNVKVGTEVVTSGLDDVSVKDVPIGTVDSVIDYEGNRTILVKPYADFDKISYVTLVPNKYAFLYLVCFGFLYDTYYFKTVGIVILTLPLLCYLLTQLGRIVKRNTYVDFLLMFLFLFLFDTINFGFAVFYGFTNESVTDFIIYQLSPSIVFNLLIFIFIKPIIEKLFLYLSVDRFK